MAFTVLIDLSQMEDYFTLQAFILEDWEISLSSKLIHKTLVIKETHTFKSPSHMLMKNKLITHKC